MRKRDVSRAFVDLQVNGFAGVDFNDVVVVHDRWRDARARRDARDRRDALPADDHHVVARSLRGVRARDRASSECRHDGAIAGIHMEGPYISPLDGFRGAHPREHCIAASIDDFARRQDAADGRIVLVTLAPEVPGAIALIEHLVARGIRVALGHTAASPDDIHAAVEAGATLSTHLGNGCAATLPRHPNIIWEQLAHDELFASFIVDGHHLPAATVKAMMRAKTPARCMLVTDAIAAAGCPPGIYSLGGLQVELNAAGRVSPAGVPGASHLAGSALSMDRAIGLTVKFTGLPLDEVLKMATTTPAAFIGIEPAGSIEVEWDRRTRRCSGSPNA